MHIPMGIYSLASAVIVILLFAMPVGGICTYIERKVAADSFGLAPQPPSSAPPAARARSRSGQPPMNYNLDDAFGALDPKDKPTAAESLRAFWMRFDTELLMGEKLLIL